MCTIHCPIECRNCENCLNNEEGDHEMETMEKNGKRAEERIKVQRNG